jgi:hypothetical protein
VVLQDRIDLLNKSIVDDRQTITNRLAGLDADVKYISQGIAELKLRSGTNR